MQKTKKNAFTLIELLVVITIIGVVTMFIYGPYTLYKKRALLNNAKKELSQDLFLARSMAINGIGTGTGKAKNYSIGLYLESGENKTIKFYGYTGSNFDITDFDKGIIIKEKELFKNVEINNISSKSGALFYFSAIKGKPTVYLENSSSSLTESGGVNYEITLGYKGIDTGLLSKKIKYNTNTYVIDY